MLRTFVFACFFLKLLISHRTIFKLAKTRVIDRTKRFRSLFQLYLSRITCRLMPRVSMLTSFAPMKLFTKNSSISLQHSNIFLNWYRTHNNFQLFWNCLLKLFFELLINSQIPPWFHPQSIKSWQRLRTKPCQKSPYRTWQFLLIPKDDTEVRCSKISRWELD